MWAIGNMLWRVGEIVEIDAQIAWTRAAGFSGVGFHASPGHPPGWKGVDPATTDADARRVFRERIADLPLREVHCPFEIKLATETMSEQMSALEPIVNFAGDVGATVATVHATLPDADDAVADRVWRESMGRLNDQATACDLKIGLEILDRFDLLKSWGLSHVGVTLDIGHLFMSEHFAGFGGSFRHAVHHIGDSLVHLHVHDVVEGVDHCQVGAGSVDFDDLLGGLSDVGYTGGMMLEANPARVDPEGIARSYEYLASRL